MKDGEMWFADVFNKKERVIVRVDACIGDYVELVDSPGCVNLEHVKFLRKIEESDLTCGDSESKNGNIPAMPIVDGGFDRYAPEAHYGMSKREMMAMQAMQGLLASESAKSWYDKHEDCAEAAVNYADALLKELDK